MFNIFIYNIIQYNPGIGSLKGQSDGGFGIFRDVNIHASGVVCEPFNVWFSTGKAKMVLFKPLDRAIINLLAVIIAPRCVHHLMNFA